MGSNPYTVILVASWPRSYHFQDRAITSLPSVRIMWLTGGISGHSAGGFASLWGSAIKVAIKMHCHDMIMKVAWISTTKQPQSINSNNNNNSSSIEVTHRIHSTQLPSAINRTFGPFNYLYLCMCSQILKYLIFTIWLYQGSHEFAHVTAYIIFSASGGREGIQFVQAEVQFIPLLASRSLNVNSIEGTLSYILGCSNPVHFKGLGDLIDRRDGCLFIRAAVALNTGQINPQSCLNYLMWQCLITQQCVTKNTQHSS